MATPIYDPSIRQFMLEFFGCGADPEANQDSQQAMIQLEPIPPHHTFLQHATRVLYQFRLLDIYAAVLSLSPCPSLPIIPRSKRPHITHLRLDNVDCSNSSHIPHADIFYRFSMNSMTGEDRSRPSANSTLLN